jgi:hypothetical protein
MSLAIVHSRAQMGVEAPVVTVEAHLANGLPSLTLVGLPETAVKESKDRVRSAIINSSLEFPARRITLNLAPADLPKDGGRFDLAIALGILAASGQLPASRHWSKWSVWANWRCPEPFGPCRAYCLPHWRRARKAGRRWCRWPMPRRHAWPRG